MDILRLCIIREEIWKGDNIVVADIEELEQMDASELHARRVNAKEVLTPKGGRRWNSQNHWRRSTSETTVREERKILQGK